MNRFMHMCVRLNERQKLEGGIIIILDVYTYITDSKNLRNINVEILPSVFERSQNLTNDVQKR